MSRIKAVLASALLFFAWSMCQGSEAHPNVNEIEPAKLKLIAQYFDLIHANVVVKNVMLNELAGMRGENVEIPHDVERKLVEIFSDRGLIVAMYAPMYNKHLSTEALSGAVTFLKSDVGQKSISVALGEINGPAAQFTNEEIKQLKEFSDSRAAKEIEKKTPLITRDAASFSHYFITNLLNGKRLE